MNCYLLLAIFAASLGSFQRGYNSRTINVPHQNIKNFFNETFKERYDVDLNARSISNYYSIAMSIYPIGIMVGSLCGRRITEQFGRKKGILYPQILSLLGAVLMGCCKFASSYEMLVIGRLLVGISSGIMGVAGTLYVVEIVPINIRGMVGVVGQLGVTSGLLTSSILGLENILGGEHTWPILLCLAAVPSFIQCIILPFMPETPRYLILSKDKIEEAENALKKLRNRDDVKSEIIKIQAEEQNDNRNENYSLWQLIVSKKLRFSLLICICLILSLQFSGIGAVLSYTTAFFESAGIDARISQYATIGINSAFVTMTLVVMPLMDRLGRRTLYLFGMSGLIVCMVMITVALNCNTNETVGFFLIGTTFMFVVFFSFLSSVPRMATAELFTQGPRSAALSIGIFIEMLSNFIVSISFPTLQDYLLEYAFLPFVIVSTAFLIMMFFYFPETKNRTSNELSLLFQAPNAWKTAIGLQKVETKNTKIDNHENVESIKLMGNDCEIKA